jgi:hypothetical protein
VAIKGSLEEASLPDVLQLLSLGRKTGCLSVTDWASLGNIYVDQGRLVYATIANRRDRIGDILLKSGKITQEQLSEAIRIQDLDRDRKVGEILVDNGAISRSDLEHHMRVQIEEAAYFMFTWRQGGFAFESNVTPKGQDFLVSIEPESLMLEGARRTDEWTLVEKKIPSFNLIFQRDDERLKSSDVTLSDHQQRIVPLLDGNRDVATIVDETAMVEFDVGKALYDLVQSGLARPTGRHAAPRLDMVPEQTGGAVRESAGSRHFDDLQLITYVSREAEFANPQRRREAAGHIADCSICSNRLKTIHQRRTGSMPAMSDASLPDTLVDATAASALKHLDDVELVSYVDREGAFADPARRRLAAFHIADCATCSKRLKQIHRRRTGAVESVPETTATSKVVSSDAAERRVGLDRRVSDGKGGRRRSTDATVPTPRSERRTARFGERRTGVDRRVSGEREVSRRRRDTAQAKKWPDFDRRTGWERRVGDRREQAERPGRRSEERRTGRDRRREMRRVADQQVIQRGAAVAGRRSTSATGQIATAGHTKTTRRDPSHARRSTSREPQPSGTSGERPPSGTRSGKKPSSTARDGAASKQGKSRKSKATKPPEKTSKPARQPRTRRDAGKPDATAARDVYRSQADELVPRKTRPRAPSPEEKIRESKPSPPGDASPKSPVPEHLAGLPLVGVEPPATGVASADGEADATTAPRGTPKSLRALVPDKDATSPRSARGTPKRLQPPEPVAAAAPVPRPAVAAPPPPQPAPARTGQTRRTRWVALAAAAVIVVAVGWFGRPLLQGGSGDGPAPADVAAAAPSEVPAPQQEPLALAQRPDSTVERATRAPDAAPTRVVERPPPESQPPEPAATDPVRIAVARPSARPPEPPQPAPPVATPVEREMTAPVVTGAVRDAGSGAGVASARVSIPEAGLAAISDAAGAFRIEGVPAGTLSVVVERDGYLSSSQRVVAEAGRDAWLSLSVRRPPRALEPDGELIPAQWVRTDRVGAQEVLGRPVAVVAGLWVESISKPAAGTRPRIRVAQLTGAGERVTLTVSRSGPVRGSGPARVTAIRTIPPTEAYPVTTGTASFGNLLVTAKAMLPADSLRTLLGRLEESPP